MRFAGRRTDIHRLVELCRKGDSEAWSVIVDRYADFVFSVVSRYRLTEEDSKDVFHATFEALYQSLGSIAQPETLPKWLAVTASRQCLRLRRASERYVALSEEALDLDSLVQQDEQSAELAAVREVEAEMVRQAVSRVGGRCTPLLTLLYLEDRHYTEIADILGIPIGAIGPTRARCLEKLRKSLQEEGFFD